MGRIIVILQQNKEEFNMKVIHNQILMGYLCLRGFRICKIEENKKHKEKNVFIFKQSDQIEEAINDYKLFIKTFKK